MRLSFLSKQNFVDGKTDTRKLYLFKVDVATLNNVSELHKCVCGYIKKTFGLHERIREGEGSMQLILSLTTQPFWLCMAEHRLAADIVISI